MRRVSTEVAAAEAAAAWASADVAAAEAVLACKSATDASAEATESRLLSADTC